MILQLLTLNATPLYIYSMQGTEGDPPAREEFATQTSPTHRDVPATITPRQSPQQQFQYGTIPGHPPQPWVMQPGMQPGMVMPPQLYQGPPMQQDPAAGQAELERTRFEKQRWEAEQQERDEEKRKEEEERLQHLHRELLMPRELSQEIVEANTREFASSSLAIQAKLASDAANIRSIISNIKYYTNPLSKSADHLNALRELNNNLKDLSTRAAELTQRVTLYRTIINLFEEYNNQPKSLHDVIMKELQQVEDRHKAHQEEIKPLKRSTPPTKTNDPQRITTSSSSSAADSAHDANMATQMHNSAMAQYQIHHQTPYLPPRVGEQVGQYAQTQAGQPWTTQLQPGQQEVTIAELQEQMAMALQESDMHQYNELQTRLELLTQEQQTYTQPSTQPRR